MKFETELNSKMAANFCWRTQLCIKTTQKCSILSQFYTVPSKYNSVQKNSILYKTHTYQHTHHYIRKNYSCTNCVRNTKKCKIMQKKYAENCVCALRVGLKHFVFTLTKIGYDLFFTLTKMYGLS